MQGRKNPYPHLSPYYEGRPSTQFQRDRLLFVLFIRPSAKIEVLRNLRQRVRLNCQLSFGDSCGIKVSARQWLFAPRCAKRITNLPNILF